MNILLSAAGGSILGVQNKKLNHPHCAVNTAYIQRAHQQPAFPHRRCISSVHTTGHRICTRAQIPAAEPIPQIPDTIPHLIAFHGAACTSLYTAEAAIQARTCTGIYTAHRAYVCGRGDALCYAVYPQGVCMYRVAAHGFAFAFRVYDDVKFHVIAQLFLILFTICVIASVSVAISRNTLFATSSVIAVSIVASHSCTPVSLFVIYPNNAVIPTLGGICLALALQIRQILHFALLRSE